MNGTEATAAARLALTLLVPLDGSATAESALAAAEYLARRSRSRILLLHAMERHARPAVHGERHLTEPAEAEAYLRRSAARLKTAGVDADVHVHPGGVRDVSASIIEHADEIAADLIVLSTHGRGGLRHAVFGTIAQSVLQHGRRSILLVPAGRTIDGFKLERIVFPLDAQHEQEPALERALSLARAFHALTDLVLVLPTRQTLRGEQGAAYRLLPSTGKALLELSAEQSAAFLERIAERWQGPEVRIETKVMRGDPVEEAIKYADSVDADLIAMATHGRADLFARVEGNTVTRLLSKAKRPLLLVRTDPP